MKTAFIILLVVHGAIHLVGFAKGFGFAEVSLIHGSIGRALGAVWLFAGLAFLAAAILLVPLVLALLDLRTTSFTSLYRREVERGLARRAPTTRITEADLAPLPQLVQTYLRRVGAVGRPHVRDVHARWQGEMKRKPGEAFMPITAEQHDFFDEPSRVFLMKARLHGVPFEGLHVYVGPSATMRVRVAGIIEVVDARGPEMNRSETVTLFNDMCLLAPATLVDADVKWQPVDARTVRATFTNAGNTISALLLFDESGDLANFTSNDRDQSADGKTYRTLPWSTPVREYEDYGGVRLPSRAEAVWTEPEGDYVYARFELMEVDFNGRARANPPSTFAQPVTPEQASAP
ncbi:MAG: hypothetical protein JWP87_6311 [Labilithrix sp.]|nr:hypothetical protein [Labilithrix sp.]